MTSVLTEQRWDSNVNHLARWVAIVVLLLPLLLLHTTWRQPRTGFFHPLIVVLETQSGTITLTKWEWYETTT